ncbi:MAG: metallophosphoesterase [Candidatus Omnitrophica bacterium]|nr:metallophosphoesterase [Candidatus Omnitrophota bacterium]MCM8793992.1 metallophosphoesterase [Candidatus Omnitrophota bacterium]
MKIGILSDTHDNLVNIEKALDLFKEQGINFFVHAGDYVAPFSLKPYFEKGFDFVGVFGNNDGEKAGLKEKSKGKIKEPPYIFNYGGKEILIVHELSQVKDLHLHNSPSVIVFGHTHIAEIKREEGTLYINPGEAGGWLTGRATFAILDLQKMEAEVMELK